MEYISLSSLETFSKKLEEMNNFHTTKMKITNCKNCGAPLKKSKCEYCGTEY